MTEKEPSITVESPRGEFEATRDNTTLFRFMGHLAMYDHIYFTHEAGTKHPSYLFNQNQGYTILADFMMDNDYPAHINLREVADCDVDAFNKMLQQETALDTEGGVPAEWTKSD
jgi:hypothetical protein